MDNRRLREEGGLEEEDSERGLGLDLSLGLAVTGAVVEVEETGRSDPKRRLGAGAPEEAEAEASLRTGISPPNRFFPCFTSSSPSSLFSSFSSSADLPPGKMRGAEVGVSSSSSRDMSISMSSSSSSEGEEEEAEDST